MSETIKVDEKVTEILNELSFPTPSKLIKDYMLTELLYRTSGFLAETQHFEKKYGTTFIEFEKKYENDKEDFKIYDDLMAWRFAEEGKNYWSDKMKEIESVL